MERLDAERLIDLVGGLEPAGGGLKLPTELCDETEQVTRLRALPARGERAACLLEHVFVDRLDSARVVSRKGTGHQAAKTQPVVIGLRGGRQ